MITKQYFDTYGEKEVSSFFLTDGTVTAEVLNYGGILRSFTVGGKNIVLGFDNISDYIKSDFFCGSVIGRTSNRIENGLFTLNGKQYKLDKNNGNNHHHGGVDGFSKRMYESEILGDTLRLYLSSADGDQGYPGNLLFSVRFTLNDGALTMCFEAESDADTLFAPTSHAYFDLSGRGELLPTLLQIYADKYLPLNGGVVPSGEVFSVTDSPFDFRQPKAIGQDISEKHIQLEKGFGYDHNFCVSGSLDRPCATAWSGGIRLDCYSDMPGLQFYSGNFIPDFGGNIFYRSAFCIEPQFYPNAINIPRFEKPILKKGERKTYTAVYKVERIS